MRVALLCSGGKDSHYAGFLASQHDEIVCLITIQSKNPHSYMFHTPSINQVEQQAGRMALPMIVQETEGKKEEELSALIEAIAEAKELHKIEGIVTGAVASVYQATRIQKICDKLKLKCINPLWLKDQIELLQELLKNKFEIIITGVAAEPLDESWLGRTIDESFIEEVKQLQESHKINPAGEGGEFETFVLDSPLFSIKLQVVEQRVLSEGQNHRLEVVVE